MYKFTAQCHRKYGLPNAALFTLKSYRYDCMDDIDSDCSDDELQGYVDEDEDTMDVSDANI